jgi:adenylate cyclase
MKKAWYLILVLLWTFGKSAAQGTESPNFRDTAYINSILQQSRQHFGDNPDSSIILANKAAELSRSSHYDKGEALALKNIGIVYYNQQKYVDALEMWEKSKLIFEKMGNDEGIANLLNNMAAIFNSQGDEAKALDYSLRSLKLAEKIGNKSRIMSSLITVASIYYNKKATYDEALKYLVQALPLAREQGDSEMLGTVLVNIGDIYYDGKKDNEALNYYQQSVQALASSPNLPSAYNGLGKVYLRRNDFEKALAFHNKAYRSAEFLKTKVQMVFSLQGISDVYMNQKQYEKALTYLDQARILAEEIEADISLKEIYQNMSLAYAGSGNYSKAFFYQTALTSIKDSIYNAETGKKIATLQFGRNLEQKQGIIDLLTKDQSLKEGELKRQRLTKNALLAGLVLIFFIAFIIFRNYRAKVRINHVLDKQKDEIESLLLNILPAEVAGSFRPPENQVPATTNQFRFCSPTSRDLQPLPISFHHRSWCRNLDPASWLLIRSLKGTGLKRSRPLVMPICVPAEYRFRTKAMCIIL